MGHARPPFAGLCILSAAKDQPHWNPRVCDVENFEVMFTGTTDQIGRAAGPRNLEELFVYTVSNFEPRSDQRAPGMVTHIIFVGGEKLLKE